MKKEMKLFVGKHNQRGPNSDIKCSAFVINNVKKYVLKVESLVNSPSITSLLH